MPQRPSEAQMFNRMNGGHAKVLRRRADGQSDTLPSDSAGDARGFLTARRTLVAWGAVDLTGGVTDVGHRLLERWEARERERLETRRRVFGA